MSLPSKVEICINIIQDICISQKKSWSYKCEGVYGLISSYFEVFKSIWEEQIIKEITPYDETENILNFDHFIYFKSS